MKLSTVVGNERVAIIIDFHAGNSYKEVTFIADSSFLSRSVKNTSIHKIHVLIAINYLFLDIIHSGFFFTFTLNITFIYIYISYNGSTNLQIIMHI